MTLKHCIVHKIERAVPGADVNVQLREQENNRDGAIYSLYEQLKQSYLRSSQKQYGFFDNTLEENPLPQWLREHQQGKSGFDSFSQRAMSQLLQQLENTDEVFSAHLLFAVETVLEQEQFYIFWINHSEAMHINNELDVAMNLYIDSAKLQYAMKVQVEEWLEDQSPKYLSLMSSRGNKALSDAFTQFCGFTAGIDLVEQTGEFLTIVDEYADTLEPDQVSEYKNKVIDYCVQQDRQGAPVVFEELSSQVNEKAPDHFSGFINERQQDEKSEIHTDRSSLKRYIRFFGRDNHMSISFAADMFGSDICYDEQTGELLIKKIPKSLRQQLARHIKAPD